VEHPLIAELTTPAWPAGTPAGWRFRAGGGEDAPAAAVAAYQARAAQLAGRAQGADHDRTMDKTGVFTGSYVINPATGEQMPVFVADYVLMDYGTGAIMAVPAHDQRDMEFARAFGLPVRAVLHPPDEWFGQHSLPAGAPAGEWPQAFTGDGRYAPVPGPPLAGLGRALVLGCVAFARERLRAAVTDRDIKPENLIQEARERAKELRADDQAMTEGRPLRHPIGDGKDSCIVTEARPSRGAGAPQGPPR